MNSAIRARREAEDGFTLIELLVVVIIIGILAAIAIPAFLNQRERAWQAELTSAVRNGALDVEAEATSAGGVYPVAWTNETDFEYDFDGDGTANDVLTYTRPDGTGAVAAGADFCLVGVDGRVNGGDNSITYQASEGGLQPFREPAAADCDTTGW